MRWHTDGLDGNTCRSPRTYLLYTHYITPILLQLPLDIRPLSVGYRMEVPAIHILQYPIPLSNRPLDISPQIIDGDI